VHLQQEILLEVKMKSTAQKTIGIAEAARKLNVTLKYVYDLVYSGRLPAEKAGRTWRIPASAIDARLKARGE
jgi:excisionase family DNA binding protein